MGLLGKEKIKSNKDSHKHKMKAKHENELKDFLSATATIKKEAKREKEVHRKEPEKKESDKEHKDLDKREHKDLDKKEPERKESESSDISKESKKDLEDKKENKRGLSSNSEVEEFEPKSKMPKLKDSDGEPEAKKLKLSAETPKFTRIPKLEKHKEFNHKPQDDS